jgi:hypothetical protein
VFVFPRRAYACTGDQLNISRRHFSHAAILDSVIFSATVPEVDK